MELAKPITTFRGTQPTLRDGKFQGVTSFRTGRSISGREIPQNRMVEIHEGAAHEICEHEMVANLLRHRGMWFYHLN